MIAALALFAPQVAAAPPPPLPMVPSIAHVHLEARGAMIVVTEDVSLPRGAWKNEPLDFHVAFGAPGAPRAIDAHLLAVPDGEIEAPEDDPGEALATWRVARRPPNATTILGRGSMAGVVVHVPPDALGRALAPGNMACLRVRYVVEVASDPDGVRRVLVRLGAVDDKPLVLGRITTKLDARPRGASAAAAVLCGPDADRRPLAVGPRGKDAPRALAPVLVPRRPGDDLCVEL
jgi:hypothetical protein